MQLQVLLSELKFKAVRSSGPGGQHVNKTSSKVEVTFNVIDSEALSEKQKERIKEKLKTRITQEGNLILSSSATRSQHKNKTKVIERLIKLLEESLKVSKPRKKTKPSKGAIEKRLKSKKQNALKKANRKPPKTE